MGCFRKRSERQAWHTLSDPEKVKILKTLAKRRLNLKVILRQKQATQTVLNYELDFEGQAEQLSLDLE